MPTPPLDHPDEASGAGPSSGKKKKRSVVPGSAADFKRREANRLAAERSRTRAAERSHALKDASYRVTSENQRLQQDIARLQIANAAAVAAGVVVPGSDDVSGVDQADESAQPAIDDVQKAQQESHSQAILNALIQGVNGTASGDAGADGHEIWGELFAEPVESKEEKVKEGRLGELADLATGQKGKGSSKSATTHGDDGALHSDFAWDHFSLADIKYDADQAVVVAASSLAVAINAEMEKVIRDDMALTKAAIMNLEKQIALLKSAPMSSAPGLPAVDPSLLPNSTLSTDVESIDASVAAIQADIDRLNTSLPRSRDELFRARDERLQAEAAFASRFEEYAGTVDSKDIEEKDKAIELVRGVGGYLADLIDAAAESAHRGKSGLFAAPLSSPAIARRRRGRPPKAFPAQSSSHSATQQAAAPGSKGKSRLSKSIHADDVTGEGDGDDLAQDTGREDEQDHAETQMIISHLAQAQAHAQAQAQARALGQGVPGELGAVAAADADDEAEGVPLPLPSGIDEATLATYFREHPLGDALDPSLAGLRAGMESPGVLSRLRKGPPGSCDICRRTETSVWRKLSLNGEDYRVCNGEFPRSPFRRVSVPLDLHSTSARAALTFF